MRSVSGPQWRSTEGKTSVGVVGAGGIAQMAHLPILSNIDDVELTYVADIDADRAKRVALEYDTDAVGLSEPLDLPHSDAVLLAIPVGVRGDYYDVFADREVDIFSEKPFARDIDEHDEWTANTRNVIANYMRTEYSTTRQLRQIVDYQLFGTVKSVTLTESYVGSTGISSGHYRTDRSLSGGGVLAERGGHTLSQLMHMLDSYRITLSDCEFVMDGELDVSINAHLNDPKRDIEIDYRATRIERTETQLELQCENATVSVDHTDAEDQITVEPTSDASDQLEIAPDERWATSWSGGIYLRWRRFLDGAVNDNKKDLGTERQVTSMIKKLYDEGTVLRRINS